MAHASRTWIVQHSPGVSVPANRTWTTIAAVTSKGFSVSGGTIDVTADDDNGFRQLLPHGTGKALSLSVEGYAESYQLRNAALNKTEDDVVFYPSGSQQDAIRFRIPDTTGSGTPPIKDLSGTFIMTAYEETGGAPDGAVTFTATFEAAGDWRYS